MAATLGQRAKDPAEVLDYTIDWTDLLAGDTISTSTFTVDAGLTKDAESNSTTSATVTVSGGTAGQNYVVRNVIVTAASKTRARSFLVRVMEL